MSKPWYASKTVIINLLASAGLLTTDTLVENINVENIWVVISLAVINIILRFVTTKPLSRF